MPTSVDLAQLKELLERGAQLVEVLPAAEYADEHLPGAISLPVQQLDATSAARLDRGRPVVVYCSACCLAAWPSRPSTREQRRRLRHEHERAAWVVQAMCCWASGAIRSRRCCGTGR